MTSWRRPTSASSTSPCSGWGGRRSGRRLPKKRGAGLKPLSASAASWACAKPAWRGPHMTATRYLIVNADDFGRSAGVNRGIIQAHEQGIVTSASLMVHWPAAREAAEYGRGRPGLSLGLHFDL